MIKFIDLFAGIGGFRLAIEDTVKSKCVFSSEIDKWAVKTYEYNFKNTPTGDITKIKSKDIPDFDLLCAGFPCQPFSIAGNRKGFEHQKGNLFFEIERILRDKQPGLFILENVKGLLNHNNKNTFEVIINSLKNLNYNVFYYLLNTKKFGLPQNRERVFIIGFHKRLNIIDFNLKEPDLKMKSLDLIFENNINNSYNVKDGWLKWFLRKHEYLLHKKYVDFLSSSFNPIARTLTARMFSNWNGNFIITDKILSKYYYNDKSKFFDLLKLYVTDKNKFYQIRRTYIRENKNNVCPTLTANMGTGGHNVPIIKDDFGIRKLTPRECARLQGFPDSFKFPVSDTHAYKQIGNSVSIPVIKFLIEQISKISHK